ncbi:MAG TPA: hypothetical protein V6D05_11405, partial [Stenomitos sp.]
MRRHSLPLLLAAGMLAGCPESSPSPPAEQPPEPLTEPGVTFPVSGKLQGPQAFLSTTEVAGQLQSFSEQALPGVKVYLADAKLTPLADGPTVTTAADGTFSIASPQRAGFLMAKTASASVALAGFYRTGHPATLSVAGTMVAWKLSEDMASHSVAITAIDPAKVDAATALIAKELVNRNLKPDYSLPTWPDGLDRYTYMLQGDFAKTFNAIIPGS